MKPLRRHSRTLGQPMAMRILSGSARRREAVLVVVSLTAADEDG